MTQSPHPQPDEYSAEAKARLDDFVARAAAAFPPGSEIDFTNPNWADAVERVGKPRRIG